MKTFRTLFSGGELFGIGAVAAGWRHVDGVEIDPSIAAVAISNGFSVRVADVCEVDYTTLPAVDHLHASPSCKRASTANQPGHDDEGNLLPRETPDDLAAAGAVARAIRAHQGDTFSLENVWGYCTFEGFERIRAALRDAGFSYDFWHLNAADYGVPQLRRRLILIARRGLCRVWRPAATHRKGGDMFHAPWVGWYEAVADLIDSLPPTRPAPWQLSSLPAELRNTILYHQGFDRSIWQRAATEPAFTVTTQSKTIRTYIDGANSSNLAVCKHDQPATTVVAGEQGRIVIRALLIGGQYRNPNTASERVVQHAHGASPSWTVTPGSSKDTRALIVGRWVRMTLDALARFQTVPATYRGLTWQINGNGVPPRLAEAIMRSLL